MDPLVNLALNLSCTASILQYFGILSSIRNAFTCDDRDVCPPINEVLFIYRLSCRCVADYVGKTIKRQDVWKAQDVPGFIRRYAPLASGYSQEHGSAIREHLMSFVGLIIHRISTLYCAGLGRNTFLTSSRRLLSTSRPTMCRQMELIHKLALFDQSLSCSGQLLFFSLQTPIRT